MKDAELLTCAHCESTEVDVAYPEELEDGDEVECEACGEVSFVWNGALVDDNEYQESFAESAACRRT